MLAAAPANPCACVLLAPGGRVISASSAAAGLRSEENSRAPCSPQTIQLMPRSGQLVNQFPYEAAIVRKDLLPQTARRLLRVHDSAAGQADDAAEGKASSDGNVSEWHPWWLPATYDLATEVHFFLKDYQLVRPSSALQR